MKKKVSILVIFAILAIVIYQVPFPIRINRIMDGFYWENTDEQSFKECEVTITGWYYCYLLKSNKFKGNFIFLIDDDMFTYYAPGISLTQTSVHDSEAGVASVYDASLNQMIYLGNLIISGNFEKVLIYSDKLNVFAPAKSSEEAIKLTEEFIAENTSFID